MSESESNDPAEQPAAGAGPPQRRTRWPTSGYRPAEERPEARKPASYITVEGNQVFLPEDALPQFVEGVCAGCPRPAEAKARVRPLAYTPRWGSRDRVAGFGLPVCAECERLQRRNGARPMVGIVSMQLTVGGFFFVTGNVWVAGTYLVMVVPLILADRWLHPAVRIVWVKRRGELAFRFYDEDAARRFVSANEPREKLASDISQDPFSGS